MSWHNLLLFALIISPSLWGKKVDFQKETTYKDRLAVQNFKLIKLKASIKELEKNLGKENNRYLKNYHLLTKLENEITHQHDRLELLNEEIYSNYKGLEKILRNLIFLENDDIDAIQLAQKKVLRAATKRRLKSLNSNLIVAKQGKRELVELKEKAANLKTVEKSILNLLTKMENRKNRLANSYVDEIRTKNNIESSISRMQKIQRKKTVAPIQKEKDLPFVKDNNNLKFGQLELPIDEVQSLDYENKGVTFFMNSKQPVKAVGSGTVAYSGPLANYGHVVLVDHADGLMTLVLGKFRARVKKGSKVEVGDILGYTNATIDRKEKLYFEVRYKDKAQNTYLWLDKELIKKV